MKALRVLGVIEKSGVQVLNSAHLAKEKTSIVLACLLTTYRYYLEAAMLEI